MKKTCSEKDCAEEVLAKGLCKTHYWRLQSEKRKARKQQEWGRQAPQSTATAAETTTQGAPPETRERKEQSVEKGKTTDKANRRAGHEMTLRFFQRDMELLRDLQEAAERERRYVSAEILVRLERLKRIEEGGDV